MLISQPLGFVPDWMFSSDPRVNIKLNPNLPIPPDWPQGQRTIQPFGYVAQKTYGDPLSGLGMPMARWRPARADLGSIDIFDSWAWRNKKWLVLGGAGLLGLAALAGAGVLLR